MKPFNEEHIKEQLRTPETRRQAFSEMVAAYSESVYWQIRHMVLSHEDANDLLQNTFVRAWVHLDTFRGESKLSTWLYKIAVNETLTFLNKQSQMCTVGMDEGASLGTDRMEADGYFNGDEAQRLLQEALLTLPDKQRLVFNMKYFQEMKYEEMSEVLGTSVGALKASYHLAVKKIGQFLEAYS